MSQELFLSRASDYYKSLCQSIGPPVSRSVGLSVRWSVSYPNNLSSKLKKMFSIDYSVIGDPRSPSLIPPPKRNGHRKVPMANIDL